MNPKQKSYIVFVQDSNRNDHVHVRRNTYIYVGFAKSKLRAPNILRYAMPVRKFKLTDNQFADLKQKYPGFSLTWVWDCWTKGIYYPHCFIQTYWFHDEIIGDMLYNVPVIPIKKFRCIHKNLKEDFASFLNCNINRANQVLRIKPPATMRAQLNKTSDDVIHFVQEITNLNKYQIGQENYFLYDDSNMIGSTFFRKLNKKFQIYGLISYFSGDKKILQKL